MESKFETIKEIHRMSHETGNTELLKNVPNLLKAWGVKLRDNDGVPCHVNISDPENGMLVVNLRYTENDETITEDIIEFDSLKPNEISKHYRKERG